MTEELVFSNAEKEKMEEELKELFSQLEYRKQNY